MAWPGDRKLRDAATPASAAVGWQNVMRPIGTRSEDRRAPCGGRPALSHRASTAGLCHAVNPGRASGVAESRCSARRTHLEPARGDARSARSCGPGRVVAESRLQINIGSPSFNMLPITMCSSSRMSDYSLQDLGWIGSCQPGGRSPRCSPPTGPRPRIQPLAHRSSLHANS